MFQLQHQIEKQEAYVTRRRDFKDSISDIHEFAKEIYQHHDLKKKKKLKRLQKLSKKGRNHRKRSDVQNRPTFVAPQTSSG